MAKATKAATAEVAKTIPWLSKTIDLVQRRVVLEWDNGAKLICNLDDLDEDMQLYTNLHGISQKVGDKVAGWDKTDYAGAVEACTLVWETLLSGRWNIRSDGVSKMRMGWIIAALVKLSGKPEETIAKMLKDIRAPMEAAGLDSAEIAEKEAAEKAAAEARKVWNAMLSDKRVAAEIANSEAAYRTEQAAKVTDSFDLKKILKLD